MYQNIVHLNLSRGGAIIELLLIIKKGTKDKDPKEFTGLFTIKHITKTIILIYIYLWVKRSRSCRWHVLIANLTFVNEKPTYFLIALLFNKHVHSHSKRTTTILIRPSWVSKSTIYYTSLFFLLYHQCAELYQPSLISYRDIGMRYAEARTLLCFSLSLIGWFHCH